MMLHDPRLTPARADLAAAHLRGVVSAARFADGERRVVGDASAPLRRAPSPDAPLDTEALAGEAVTVYETTAEGWSWGQLDDDGYVGWLPAGALAAPGPDPTHRVSALRTLVFPGPSIKLPPVASLPLGARVGVMRLEGPFAVTRGGFIPAVHLVPLGTHDRDFVAVAERFLGTPYLWGGKTNAGLDCSGLVQVSLAACGVACPRDSDMQERALGVPLRADAGYSNLRRGDLVFWSGHVAIVRDPAKLLHANAFHMAVAQEPIVEAITRILPQGEPTAVKRLSNLPG